MGQQEHYCSICGGPLLNYGLVDEWNDAIFLLTAGKPDKSGTMKPLAYDLETEPAGLHLMRIPADLFEGCHFNERLSGNYEACFALWPEYDEDDEPSKPLYVPVHQVCMDIVDQLIAKRRSMLQPHRLSNVDEMLFWKILVGRYRNSYFGHDCHTAGGCLPEPRDYLGGSVSRQFAWEDGPDKELQEANPCSPTAIEIVNSADRSADPPPDISVETALSTRNRKRIWDLVESARLGDV